MLRMNLRNKYLVVICIICYLKLEVACGFRDVFSELQAMSNPRAAIILTMAGQGVPPYLSWSCYSIGASAPVFDMFIFHENNEAILSMNCAQNVHKVNVGQNGLARYIAKALLKYSVRSRYTLSQLSDSIAFILTSMPYFLAEFKPSTGAVFEEFLSDYTHWTYTDPDIFWGNISMFLTPDEMSQYDVITFAKYLDAYRLFLRGQFTLHKNIDRVNKIFSKLTHLEADKVYRRMRRIAAVLNSTRYDKSLIKRHMFTSAEGAYSEAVFEDSTVSVLVAGRMFSDRNREAVLWKDNRLARCRSRKSIASCIKVHQSFTESGGRESLLGADNTLPPMILREGTIVRVDCGMGWLPSKYQVCLTNRNSTRYNEVVRLEGVWSYNDEDIAQRYRRQEAALFHFRIWEDFRVTRMLPGLIREGEPCFISYVHAKDMHIHHCNDYKQQAFTG